MPVTMSAQWSARFNRLMAADDQAAKATKKTIVAPSHPPAAYDQIDELPPLMNKHLMAPSDGEHAIGTNQFPYAELLQAKDTMRALLGLEEPKPKPKPRQPGEKLTLFQRQALQQERSQRAIVDEARASEFMLTITNVAGTDVPDADDDAGWSDPYVSFALLDCDPPSHTVMDATHTAQLRCATEPQRNAKHPTFRWPIKLWLPAGSAGSLSAASRRYPLKDWEAATKHMLPGERERAQQLPTVRVRILDRDLEMKDDEMIGEATVPIPTLGAELSGVVEGLALKGRGRFKQSKCKVGFAWAIEPYEPTPPAALALRSVTVEGLNPPPKAKTHDRLYAKQTTGSNGKKGLTYQAKVGAPTGQYLRFSLLEVGDDLAQPSDTVPHAKILGVDFYLPRGSRRAPLLRVQIFDSSPDPATGHVCDEPVSTTDHRLAEADGEEEVVLHYNYLNAKGQRRLKKAVARFTHATAPLEAEVVTRLSRVGIVEAHGPHNPIHPPIIDPRIHSPTRRSTELAADLVSLELRA